MEVRTRKVGVASVIDLKGQIDLSSSSKMRTAVLEAIKAKDASRVAVNLTEVSYIDSSGIATLVEGLQLARSKNCHFVIFGLQQAPREVLELARLDKVFEIRLDESAALSS
jgi:anti-sigma B factor antagonist